MGSHRVLSPLVNQFSSVLQLLALHQIALFWFPPLGTIYSERKKTRTGERPTANKWVEWISLESEFKSAINCVTALESTVDPNPVVWLHLREPISWLDLSDFLVLSTSHPEPSFNHYPPWRSRRSMSVCMSCPSHLNLLWFSAFPQVWILRPSALCLIS